MQAFRRAIIVVGLVSLFALPSLLVALLSGSTPTPIVTQGVPVQIPASAPVVDNYTYAVQETPAQEGQVMLNAYVYGVGLGAWVTCAQQGYAWSNTAFADCNWILGAQFAGYSANILIWWSHYGYAVVFYFGATQDSYNGYSVFAD